MGSAEEMVMVDRCITKLVAVKSMRPGTEVCLPEEDIMRIVKRSREVFLSQPMLLEVRVLAIDFGPLFLCGELN
ncbi:unnamed protein product, partial [Discosporangium mesarthrocarpum]